MDHRIVAFAVAWAIGVSSSVGLGTVLLGAWNGPEPTKVVVQVDRPDPCQEAVSGLVEAIETTWSTASEAVDRAQQAVQAEAVDRCLEASS